MDWSIIGILSLDGAANGTIYALLAVALVLVFSVTRVIFIPQGEFVALGALTVGIFQAGQIPGTVWMLGGLAFAAAASDAWLDVRAGKKMGTIARGAASTLALPLVACALSAWLATRQPPLLVQCALTLALVTPMGALLHRLVYRSLADSSILVLLIVSVGVHFALTGFALLFFGAEGYRIPAIWEQRFAFGPVVITGQMFAVFGLTVLLIGALFLFFDKTLRGKALRATAVNRTGARLIGISTDSAGRLSFTLAAFVGALSGLLIGPTTTVFYDTGFLIGLKGFVAAVFGGLASFPGALIGALLVGLIESFGSFWMSAFKEVIVFTMILPVLLWRSFADHHVEEH